MRRPHRVLLVGPWRAGATGGGCCGGAEALGERHEHEHTEATQAADVVRSLRAALGEEADVELVDPRNTVYLLPAVYRDARHSGLGVRSALAASARATTPWALVVDGRVVSRSDELTAAGAARLVGEALSRRERRPGSR